jgi:hypothetical protein
MEHLDRDDRARLKAALLALAPWLDAPDVGPRSVDAGACDACDDLPRLLPTCGPAGHTALCAACADTIGLDAWCDGHRDEAETALSWAARLPERWPDLVVLWWVATGEVRPSATSVPDLDGLPATISATLSRPRAR